MTATLILSICLLISSSSGTNLVTFPLLILSALKTSNDLSIGFIFIHSFFTSCLLILVWVYPESTSIFNHSYFLFDILMFVYTLSSLSLLFCQWGIIYQFRNLLCIEVHHTVPTPNLQQNLSVYCFYYLSPFVHFWSSSFILSCNLLLDISLCHICNTFLSSFLFLAFSNSFSYICIYCS